MKVFPLAIAVLLVAYALRRWRSISTERRVLCLAAAALLGVYGSGLVELPNVEELIKDVGEALGPWTYLLVGVMAFLETGAFVGLVVPGETTIIVGGVVAGQGEIDVVVLVGLVWACAVAGDLTSYAIGRRMGRDVMLKYGPKVKITRARLEQVERFYARHGGKAILLGRFIGLVRAVSPFIAGASRLPLGRFLPYDIIGCGLWGSAFVVLGYVFWRSFDRAAEIAGRGAFALATLIVVVVGGIALYRFLRVPENRARVTEWLDEQERRPGVGGAVRALRAVYRRIARPVVRVAAVPLRFAWRRVTPGELGLELTTLLAVALVGAFVFGGLASLLTDQELTSGDRRALRIVSDLHTDAGIDLVKLLSSLGSFTVVTGASAVTAVWLVVRRRWTEAVTIALALPLTLLAVHVAKAAEDRPRPLGSLVPTDGSSFPSGHAAYAVAFVAIGVVFVRVGRGIVSGALVMTVVLALAAGIGLSRVYLRAHFLSDVVGGWALGSAIFALCAMSALIVSFLRQNARR